MSPLKREFEYFLLLCKTLNISKAAEEAGIQQSGLSKSLKTLESQFEKPVFYRTSRGLKITPFGNILRKNLQNFLESWDQSFQKDLKTLNEIVGKYTIGIHPTVAVNVLKKFFPKLCESHPGLQLDLILDNSPSVVKSVIDHQVDIGIVANPSAHLDLVISPLQREYIACWSVQEKSSSKVVYFNPEMINILQTIKKFSSYKQIPINDYEVIASIVLNSGGVSILPNTVAERFPKLKKTGKKLLNVEICMVYRHDILKTPATKAIFDSIRSAFS